MIKINKKGQGLIEVITAIYVIVIGLLSIMNLVVFNIQLGGLNNDILVASNLAREGVEVVRNVRDGNWLSGISWDNNLVFPDDITPLNESNPKNSFYIYNNYLYGSEFSYSILPTGISLAKCMSDQSPICKLGIIKKQGSPNIKFYDILGSNNSSNIESSHFYRIIYINEICLVNADPNNYQEIIKSGFKQHCSSDGYSKIGIQVISSVSWNYSFGTKKIEVEDRFYNWK